MIRAFDATLGVVMGLIVGFLCLSALIFSVMYLLDHILYLIDRQIARAHQDEWRHPSWENSAVPAIWDTKPDDPPRAPPTEEIESWWQPIDPWDNKP